MAKKWNEVAGSDGFKSLPPEQQDDARRQYFDQVVAPQVPEEHREKAWDQFSTDSGVGRRELPKDVKPSTAGAGRGVTVPAVNLDEAQASPQPVTSEKTRAQRIAEMDEMMDGINPTGMASTAAANPSIVRPGRRESVDDRRTRYPGRVLNSDIEPMTPTGVVRDVVSGALQIPGVVAKGAGDLARMATGDRIGKDLSAGAESVNKAIRENVGSWRAQQQEQRFQQDMADKNLDAIDVVEGNPGALADQVLPTVGSMALPIGSAALAGKLATGSKAAKLARVIDEGTVLARADRAREAAVIGTTVAQNASDTYSTVRDAGGSQEDAYKAAGIAALATAAAGKLTGGGAEANASHLLAGAKGTAKAIPKAMMKEGAQEMGEEAGQYVGESLGTGKEMDANTASKRLAVAGTLGAVMGGGVEAAGTARAARENRITALRDAGEKEAADLLQKQHEKQTTLESVDAEIGKLLGNDSFNEKYKELRINGLKPAESAARAAVTVTYSEIAQQYGVPEKAMSAALDSAQKMPLDKVPGFLHKFTDSLAKRGLVSPDTDIASIGPSLEAARDDAMDAAVGAVYQPVKPIMDDVMALEGEQNKPQALAEPAQTATETIANVQDTTPSDGLETETTTQAIQADAPVASNAATTQELPGTRGTSLQADGVSSAIIQNAEIAQQPQTLDSQLSNAEQKDNAQTTDAAPDIGTTQVDETPAVQPAASGDAPTPDAPVHIGRDNTPLAEGGKAFKTRKAADDARKLNPSMRVVRAEGGYALTEKTPAQIAAQEAAAKRLSQPRTSPAGEPIPAHAFIAAEGGLAPDTKADMGMQANVTVGNRKLFAGQGRGLTIERATERLVEEGYLPKGASHDQARELIKRSLTKPQYTPEGTERMAAAELEARRLAQQEAIADVEELGDNQFQELDADIPYDAPSNVSEAEAMRAMGFTEQEIEDATTQRPRIESADSQGSGVADASPTATAQADNGQRASPQGEDSRSRSNPRRQEAQVEPQQTPAPAGVSTSGPTFQTTPRPDGTLTVKGDAAAIREALKDIPASSLVATKDGILVGKTQADKAASILRGEAPKISAREAAELGKAAREADKKAARQRTIKATEGLSIGIMPSNAEPVTVKNGVIFIGNSEALNFDTGEPIRIGTDATSQDIADALKDGGALSRRQRVFGLGPKEGAAPPDSSSEALPESANKLTSSDAKPEALIELRKRSSVLKSLLKCLGA